MGLGIRGWRGVGLDLVFCSEDHLCISIVFAINPPRLVWLQKQMCANSKDNCNN